MFKANYLWYVKIQLYQPVEHKICKKYPVGYIPNLSNNMYIYSYIVYICVNIVCMYVTIIIHMYKVILNVTCAEHLCTNNIVYVDIIWGPKLGAFLPSITIYI